jgi:arylsulfatase A-like enzyme
MAAEKMRKAELSGVSRMLGCRRYFKVWLSLALCLGICGPVRAADRPPNIVFVLADDLGYGDLGCYAQKRIRTPNLDRMAKEGLRFTHFYAGCTVCAPSRCALMTGMHTGHATIRGNDSVPLRPDDRSVAELLKGAGYATALVGKWGLGEPGTTGTPDRKGFDYLFGYLNQFHAHNSYPDYLWKNREKVTIAGNVVKDGVASVKSQFSQDLFTREALTLIEQNRARPFFLYLAYTIPHANNERGRMEGNGLEVPDDAPYANEPWPAPQKNYAAMITRLDADVGRLFKHLKELALDEKTIVFFSSDNGPHMEGGADPTFFHSAGPFRGHKRDLTEGGIRVPLIVRAPGIVRPGRVTEQVGAFWDFLPTVAELAGVPIHHAIDGLSLAPTLTEHGTQKQHEFLYWEFHEQGSKQAVLHGEWKAIRTAVGQPLELYDLASDPGETRDVAASNPGEVAKIDSYLKSARTDSPHWPLVPSKKPGVK